jgi:hypothetical protein
MPIVLLSEEILRESMTQLKEWGEMEPTSHLAFCTAILPFYVSMEVEEKKKPRPVGPGHALL